jgi:hypothetical protein
VSAKAKTTIALLAIAAVVWLARSASIHGTPATSHAGASSSLVREIAPVVVPVSSEVAQRLVRAMKIDQRSLLGLQLGVAHRQKEGTATEEQLACINNLQFGPFGLPFANAIQHSLSDTEAHSAIVFYESATGVRYASYSLDTLRSNVGAAKEAKPSWSDRERKEIAAFTATTAGQKLTGRYTIFDAPETWVAIQPIADTAMRSCNVERPRS